MKRNTIKLLKYPLLGGDLVLEKHQNDATAHLCHTLTQMTFDTLSDEVIGVTKRIILDGIAVAVAGAKEPGPTIAAEHVKSQSGKGVATVMGHGFRTSPVLAAYANGISMHVLDFEPMWSPPTHATSPTLPSILALAEEQQSSGREIITAFVKGCELQGHIRLASHQYAPGDFTVHPPSSVGLMGSAAASGHMLGLNQEQLQHALGITASRAGGLMANVGTMAKATHCGWAAMSGLDAALLASRGFTGNSTIFEAPNGYVERFFGEQFNYDELLSLGQSYRMVDPGFVIKMFPCQYGTHFGILAALELQQQIADASSIQAIHITSPVMPYVDRPDCKSGLDGKFSFQYTVAAALLDGEVNIHTFSDAYCTRPDLVGLMARTHLTQDENVPGVLEHMWVDVAVELRDGHRLSARCDGPQGFWDRAALPRNKHLVKIQDCLHTYLDDEKTEQCIQLVDTLETLEAPQIAQLMSLLH